MKNTVPKCGTVIPAKAWRRKNPDIGASGQRWYCLCCGCKDMTHFGVLVGFHFRSAGRGGFFFKAEVTDED
eukprot:10577663-Alexandrium_andersonii.AAC.1